MPRFILRDFSIRQAKIGTIILCAEYLLPLVRVNAWTNNNYLDWSTSTKSGKKISKPTC